MPIGTNGLFSATTVSTASAWKPTNAAASGSGKSLVASAFAPVDKADGVSTSPLGKALTGAAAKLFEQLDAKSREKLEGLVSSGTMKAEDVVKGLRGIAKEAVSDRYQQELPRNAEGIRQSQAYAAYSENYKEFEKGQTALGKSLQPIIHDNSFIDTRITNPDGSIESDESYGQRMNEHIKKVTDAHKKISDYKTEFEKKNGSLQEPEFDPQTKHEYRARINIRRAGLFDDESDRNIHSLEDSAAERKLIEAGLTRGMFRDAATKYAAGVDLSNVRDVPPSEYPEPEPDAPVVKPGEDVVPNRPPSIFTHDMPQKLKPMAISYDANGNAQLPGWMSSERLQAPGLVSGTGANSGTTANDAILAALKDSLKNGGASASQDRTDTLV
ncbi:hypothetical protein [Azospirillum sp.]|uniref:hypothetical protein n=1 Tax=Azospirillum sp. TaxID=34012 RepID=UPI0026283407|nr:hypothetical protein [Azospirillum sp.]